MKRTSKCKIVKWIKILLVVILIFTAYILGYAKGLDNLPRTTSGPYNIEIYDNGKVVITTKLRHIAPNEETGRLIIYGEPTHEPIK